MKLVNPSCIVDDQKEFDLIGIKKHMTKIKKPNTIKLNTIKSPQVVYNYITLILIILSSKIN